MAFWWVNHKQTYRQETEGGYVWSPKASNDGRRKVTYDNLVRCQASDVVFSYANGKISQIALVEQASITAPKPLNSVRQGTTGARLAPQRRTLDFQSALAVSLDSRVLLKG